MSRYSKGVIDVKIWSRKSMCCCLKIVRVWYCKRVLQTPLKIQYLPELLVISCFTFFYLFRLTASVQNLPKAKVVSCLLTCICYTYIFQLSA